MLGNKENAGVSVVAEGEEKGVEMKILILLLALTVFLCTACGGQDVCSKFYGDWPESKAYAMCDAFGDRCAGAESHILLHFKCLESIDPCADYEDQLRLYEMCREAWYAQEPVREVPTD